MTHTDPLLHEPLPDMIVGEDPAAPHEHYVKHLVDASDLDPRSDADASSVAAPTLDATPGVTIKITDEAGNITMSFPASKERSISEDAEKAGFEIPTSCRAGACFVCAGRVKSGLECVDIGKISVPLIDIDDDQVLTCVGGIYDRCFDDGGCHEVVIQKGV